MQITAKGLLCTSPEVRLDRLMGGGTKESPPVHEAENGCEFGEGFSALNRMLLSPAAVEKGPPKCSLLLLHTLKMNKLLQLLLIVLVSLALGRSVQAVVPTTEIFGNASDGTVLHWMAYTPTTPGPWPVVLIIHGGGFDSNTPDSSPESVNCAQDMAAAGYIAFSIEYRLAPPGALPGQVSDGRFPINRTTRRWRSVPPGPISVATARSPRSVVPEVDI